MKKIVFFISLVFIALTANAQNIDYKKGMITVDGNDYAKVEVTKQNFGLTKLFDVFSLSGESKLVGGSGILVNDKVDENKVKQFIAAKGASPSIAVDYTLVARNKAWPISLQVDKTIEQNSKIIGSFKPAGSGNGLDHYEFTLPSGVMIAKVSFTGGNNAQNMELFTAKDNLKRTVPIPQQEKIIIADASIDKNQFTIKRIAKWLVDNQYL
ncbi:MAG: hypothetical protein IPM85_15335 [Chitinophagaceae bacterium]|nr:hypothetical protein [Chitinophagaceae bacterium]